MMSLTSRRSCRPVCALFLVAIVIYIPINLIYIVASAVRHDGANTITYETKQKSTDTLDVKVSDVRAGSEPGKVDLVLSVDVHDLVRLLDNVAIPEGAMTANALPGNVSILLHNPDICASRELDWVVYVHSSPGNAGRRMNVRRTWADINLFKRHRFAVVFLIGKPESTDAALQDAVQHEFATYGDLVQGDFYDNYKNLTLKGIMALKWVSKYCPNAPYAIKSDDDAFVNIFEIVKIMEQNRDKKRHITCPLWKDNTMPILRDPAKCMKWCVKRTEFPGRQHFPKYCAGLSYILSQDVISQMYQASFSTPFFWIDDVYITGLLPQKVKDISYVDLLRNFTLKEPVAMEMYTDMTKPVSIYFIHIKKEENFEIFWKLSLQRLSPVELGLLSDSVLDKFPELKLRDKMLGLNFAVTQKRS